VLLLLVVLFFVHLRSRVSSLWLLSARNKWYQSFPGSSWDFLAIRRASGADLMEIVCRSQISGGLVRGIVCRSQNNTRSAQGIIGGVDLDRNSF